MTTRPPNGASTPLVPSMANPPQMKDVYVIASGHTFQIIHKQNLSFSDTFGHFVDKIISIFSKGPTLQFKYGADAQRFWQDRFTADLAAAKPGESEGLREKYAKMVPKGVLPLFQQELQIEGKTYYELSTDNPLLHRPLPKTATFTLHSLSKHSLKESEDELQIPRLPLPQEIQKRIESESGILSGNLFVKSEREKVQSILEEAYAALNFIQQSDALPNQKREGWGVVLADFNEEIDRLPSEAAKKLTRDLLGEIVNATPPDMERIS